MNKIYKRVREEDTYECGLCDTTWRESTVERQGLDKNCISCPCCHAYFDCKDCEIVHLDAVKYKNKRIKRVLQRKFYLEQQLEEGDNNRMRNESTPLQAHHSHGSYERSMDMIKGQHHAQISRQVYSNTMSFIMMSRIAQVDKDLEGLMDIPDVREFPRTKTQNCISHGTTIKPQIDWVEFDAIYGEKITNVK